MNMMIGEIDVLRVVTFLVSIVSIVVNIADVFQVRHISVMRI